MSVNMFRVFIITLGFILVYALALVSKIPVEKFILCTAFVFALDSIAKDIVMKILLAQNKDLVEKVTKNIKEEMNDTET